MLHRHLVLALRTLRRRPGYAGLNIVGLALGIACCLLIALWVRDEQAFDRFHTQSERIYRLNKVFTPPTGARELHALSSGPMGPALETDFPEVEAAVRVLPWWGEVLLGPEADRRPVADVTFADAALFDVFDFALRRGDPATALTAPRSIVLSERLARSFFGEADPLGQTILGPGDLTYTVTGLVEDAPAHSHLRYRAFVSWSTLVPGNGALEMDWLERWTPQALFTYVLLQPGADAEALDAKLPAFMQRHFAERADQYHLYLQPLEDIYLGSADVLYQRSMAQGNRTYVYVFSAVAVLILLIACINFMNLATARAGRRAVEVGVRKVMGAGRGQLVRQFLGEAVLLAGLALLLAMGLTEAARPAFNALTGKAFSGLVWTDPLMLAALVGLWGLVALAAGLYPAFVLSGFSPARVLKGGSAVGGRRFRQLLVTMQFTASIVLLVGTLVIYQQMQFVHTADPGFDRDQIIVLPTGSTAIEGSFGAFQAEVLRHPGVAQATGTSSVPGQGFSTYTILPEGRPEDEGLTAAALFLNDDDLLATYGLTLAEGRFFDDARPADSLSIVINEAMMRSLGWTDAVGKRFDVRGELAGGTVIGVVEDFHMASLHQEVAPLFMAYEPVTSNLSVRLAGADAEAVVAHLRATWERFETAYPFTYTFLDDTFAQLYASDRRLLQTLGVFAGLAVLVACLGLFGLAAYAAEQRTKEIGIRKVLGASLASLNALLLKDFLKLIVVAFMVAVPVAYVAMQRWLDDFAYHIELGPGVFLTAGGAAVLVALATVSLHALRTAAADPVESLRSE